MDATDTLFCSVCDDTGGDTGIVRSCDEKDLGNDQQLADKDRDSWLWTHEALVVGEDQDFGDDGECAVESDRRITHSHPS